MRVVAHGYEGPRMTAQTATVARNTAIAAKLARGEASWFMSHRLQDVETGGAHEMIPSISAIRGQRLAESMCRMIRRELDKQGPEFLSGGVTCGGVLIVPVTVGETTDHTNADPVDIRIEAASAVARVFERDCCNPFALGVHDRPLTRSNG